MNSRNRSNWWCGNLLLAVLTGILPAEGQAEDQGTAVFKKQAVDAVAAPAAELEKDVQQVTAFYEKGRFAGWPATHGVWIWGNEILTGFSFGYHKDLGAERHNIDREKPETHHLLRSLDGGVTWSVESPNEQGVMVPQGQALHGKPHPVYKERSGRIVQGGSILNIRIFA